MPDDDKFHVIKTSMYELTKVLNIKQNGKTMRIWQRLLAI